MKYRDDSIGESIGDVLEFAGGFYSDCPADADDAREDEQDRRAALAPYRNVALAVQREESWS